MGSSVPGFLSEKQNENSYLKDKQRLDNVDAIFYSFLSKHGFKKIVCDTVCQECKYMYYVYLYFCYIAALC